jgi:heme/copper-type cytochrome/quinol oxidase subunit 3
VNAPATSLDLAPRIRELGWDESRGVHAMLWFILTEAMLFVSLFFAYFFLASRSPHWPMDDPPKLKLALVMLVVLLASSVALEWGRHQNRRGRESSARGSALAAVVLGLLFLYLQTREYAEHLRTLRPTADAYASLFYTITSVHGAHVVLGLLMLTYVVFLPRIAPGASHSPHQPFHVASLYWHFVDAAWAVIVLLLYVLPNVHRT